MFENLKNLGGLMSMLGNAKELREKMQRLQEELARKTVEGESGAGAVRVTVNGKFEVVGVRLDRPLLLTLAAPDQEGDEADAAMIEELIASAVNVAMEKAREMAAHEMSKLTGGLDMSAIEGMMPEE